MKLKVLFLCATNGVQSPIAAALLNTIDPQHFEVESAGVDRGEMHPFAVDAMKEIGVDLRGQALKHVKDVAHRRFDIVITLCDRSRFECPEFPGAELVHWQLDDPLKFSDQAKQKRMFQFLRDQIAQRVRLFALVQIRFAPVPLTAEDHQKSARAVAQTR
jgi:protein-tyrosine-phosphatase